MTMSTLGGLAPGMAFLPTWLGETKDPTSLDSFLAGTAKASGWRYLGLAWPIDESPRVFVARPDGPETAPHLLPVEWGEMAKSVRSSGQTVVWQLPASSGRIYTLIAPPGRDPGLIWAEKAVAEVWSEVERSYFRLVAKLIERSATLAARIGPLVDPERLQQRLQDASLIAGRMAHDFDNILTGIIGFADLTVPLVPAGSQASKFVSEIAKVGQRGIVFTQQLHQLSRSGQVKPQPGSVPAAIAREEARIRPAMPPGLVVRSDVPASLAAVAMEAGPLQTVIGHLLENAAEACAADGQVVVSAKAVELSLADGKAYLGQVGPGAHVEVAVQDNASGIKPEVRAKLFAEPFYTTKVRHRGLGLAIVYKVLFAHRGGIRIDPVPPPQTGTVVRIVLPLAAARPVVAPTATPTGSPNIGG
jgi:signal transduction histidine kinase